MVEEGVLRSMRRVSGVVGEVSKMPRRLLLAIVAFVGPSDDRLGVVVVVVVVSLAKEEEKLEGEFWLLRMVRRGSRYMALSVRAGVRDFLLWPMKRSSGFVASNHMSASTPVHPAASASYRGTRRQ